MTSKSDIFYIGSCRYMYDFDWNYFRARLHTTREIIYYLENIHTIQKIVDKYPADLVEIIFGDLMNPNVTKNTAKFTKEPLNNIKKLVLEISSRKQYYYRDIPVSQYYTELNRNLISKYKLKYIDLTDADIERDLVYIIQLLKKIFNTNIELIIIPHLNLKTKDTNNYIPSRNALVELLTVLSHKLGYTLYNIGKFLESTTDDTVYLDVIMSNNRHYSSNFDTVRQFLIKNIFLTK